ncbi:MAG: glycosyltransferase family 39 protein [Acidobacteria bacterium]|nr:glycosyltransferase family 39 protein [Acidobacteriota bacterium]
MIEALYKRRLVLLVLITLLAFALRFYRLDAAGLSEDETHKIDAVAAYQVGDYTANAEHPMLMKALSAVCVITVERLDLPISPETALRLPNVIFGSLTCIILYLFFTELFSFRIGILTSLIWAINPHAILINRVAKEDTLLVFFLWLGYYLARRAKKATESESFSKIAFWGGSGASFGLMLASKYFPHYFGLNFLYYHLVGPNKWNNPIKGKHLLLFFITMPVVFLIASPAILMPGTISYMAQYSRTLTVTHHGYWMMGELYQNDAAIPLTGLPIYFYLLALAIKTQLPLLIAFIIGAIEVFRKRTDEPYFFLRFMLLVWLIPYSIFGAKWLRYILAFMPQVCATMAIGLSVTYDALKLWWEKNPQFNINTRLAFTSIVSILFLLVPTINIAITAPFYSLYLNALGKNKIGYYFPHDEFYDLGLREAVKYVAEVAEPKAIIANEAESVIIYYSKRFNRPDLRSQMMSNKDFKFSDEATTYVLLQDGRRYFENKQYFDLLENNYIPIKEIKVMGATAVKIYKVTKNLPSKPIKSDILVIQ